MPEHPMNEICSFLIFSINLYSIRPAFFIGKALNSGAYGVEEHMICHLVYDCA